MKIWGLILFYFSCSLASAGYLIEPYFAQHSGKRNAQYSPALGSTVLDADLAGGGMGVRIAYATPTWWVGLTAGSYDSAASINSQNTEFRTAETGLNFGYLYKGFRFFGTYFWDSTKIQSVTSGTGDEATTTSNTYKGSAFRLGIGYLFYSQITLNLEYTLNSFKTVSSDTATADVTTAFSKYQYNPIFLTVGYAFGASRKK